MDAREAALLTLNTCERQGGWSDGALKKQLAATELYPGFTRKIYLKSYRYNMHLCPKSLLIEVGAQTNTLQEAVNAMDPLAQVLDKVLSGK